MHRPPELPIVATLVTLDADVTVTGPPELDALLHTVAGRLAAAGGRS